MTRTWPHAGVRGCVGAALLACVTSCADTVHEIPMRTPSGRPSDGLLHDARLQAVVDLQEGRDAAGLVKALSDDRADVRARAAFALGSVQAPEALHALVAALGDAEPAVRRDAAFALGQLGADSAVVPLVRAFRVEPDDAVRRRVLEALGKVPTRGAAEALAALDVPDALAADRLLAVALLGGERHVLAPSGLDLLLARLDDVDPRLREAAAYYFGRSRTTERWAAHAARVRQVLDGYAEDDPAAMYLVQGLGRLEDGFDAERLGDWAEMATDWRTRVNAMAALGRPPAGAETREELGDGLDDPSGHVAIAAATSLATVDSTGAELRLTEAWIGRHPDRWRVVEPLLAGVATAGDSTFVFAWIDGLPAADTVRQIVGVRALAAVRGGEARGRILADVGSPVEAVSAAAVQALARRWRDERDEEALRDTYFAAFRDVLLSGDPSVAFTAARVLADSAFVPRGEAVLEEAARSTEPARRRAATRALDELRAAPDTGAEGGGGAGASRPAQPDSVASPTVDWAYLEGLGSAPRLVLDTERGRVVVRLAPEEAPLTVQTIARFVERGAYVGVPFHRVVSNFVVQGGDLSRTGLGPPRGFAIRSEFTLIPYRRGVIGMASSGKDTETSQFFITHSMQPHLDGAYTSFGWVVEGMDVVDRILVGDRIVRATIEPGS